MKQTQIQIDPTLYPKSLHSILKDATVYDSSCSPEARVIFIDRDEGYYLKSAAPHSLAREAEMGRYFHKKGLAPEVISYHSDCARDWLLTARGVGEDCTAAAYLADPARLCDTLAECLRMLHGTEATDCPVKSRMTDYLKTAEEGYRTGRCDLSFFTDFTGEKNVTAEDAWQIVTEGGAALKNDTLLHGDYCLPNILLKDWQFSCFIDVGNGGVGDRHVDLYWGAWTLAYNLKTDRYRQRFFDAYGKESVDTELLRVIAAAEAFG